jgi:hypothetical protein
MLDPIRQNGLVAVEDLPSGHCQDRRGLWVQMRTESSVSRRLRSATVPRAVHTRRRRRARARQPHHTSRQHPDAHRHHHLVPLGFILARANRKSLLADAANGPIFRVEATIAVIVVAIMAAGAIVTEVPGLLG